MPTVKPKARKPATPFKIGAGGRKQAPKDISVLDEYYQDESAIILSKAKAALGESKAEGMSFMYGSPTPQTAENLSLNGWVPVVTEDENGNNKHWRQKADPLLMRPKGQSERSHSTAAAVARDQLRNTLDARGESGFDAE